MRIARYVSTFFVGCLFLLSASSVFAMVCRGNDQENDVSMVGTDIYESVVSSADVPDGTELWRSEFGRFSATCYNDTPGTPGENIYFHINPDVSNIGQGIRLNLILDGVSYNQQSGRIDTGYTTPDCLPDVIGECPSIEFPLMIMFSVEKYGKTPVYGYTGASRWFATYQVDGEIPTPDQKNLVHILEGLDQIRFVACSPDLTVEPATVNFGLLSSDGAQPGKVAATRPFSLYTSRDCTTPFSVDARFAPMDGLIVDDLLVPTNNDSVGISIRKMDDGEVVPFKKWFVLSDLMEQASAITNLEADVLWRTSTPQLGLFDAALVIDLVYK